MSHRDYLQIFYFQISSVLRICKSCNSMIVRIFSFLEMFFILDEILSKNKCLQTWLIKKQQVLSEFY